MLYRPLLYLGMVVRGVVVQNEMPVSVRRRERIDEPQELHPSLVMMPVVELPMNAPLATLSVANTVTVLSRDVDHGARATLLQFNFQTGELQSSDLAVLPDEADHLSAKQLPSTNSRGSDERRAYFT